MLVVIDTGANGRVKPLILYVVLFLFIFSCLDFIFNFFCWPEIYLLHVMSLNCTWERYVGC